MQDLIVKMTEFTNKFGVFAIVTIIRSSGSTPRKIGAKMLVAPGGEIHGSVGGGTFEKQAIVAALASISSGTTRTFACSLQEDAGQVCGGKVEALIEIFGAGPELHVFGAGHVGLAIAEVLTETPFRVHLVDTREEWLCKTAAIPTIKTHHRDWLDYVNTTRWNSNDSYAVVLTYDHNLDLEIISALARQPVKYRGLIGSKSKWHNFKGKLVENGLTPEEITAIRCPIGLIQAGNTPKEIAISLAAELLACLYAV